MDPFTGMAVASAGSNLLGGALSYVGAKEQNASAEQIAREQMAFQKGMSDTAMQRKVADLRAAGLNPILAADGGGASTPGGAGFMPTNKMAGIDEAIGKAVSSAIDSQRFRKEMMLADSQVNVLDAEERLKETQSKLNESQEKINQFNARMLATELPRAEGAAEAEKVFQGSGMFGNILRVLDTLGKRLKLLK